jgi:TatD DNase family protein
MYYIDTHTHTYQEYYPDGFKEMVQRALDAHVEKLVMPCVTAANIPQLFEAQALFPKNLFPLVGLHPTEVKKETYLQELLEIEKNLEDDRVIGIGETGIDLYWDKTTLTEQEYSFRTHLYWARDHQLPLSIHIRNAYGESIAILNEFRNTGLKGVMHCFSGGLQEAVWAIKFGFFLGIGGVLTFKNNKLQEIVKEIGLEYIVLETDAPFLSPVPFRGKINESAYIPYIAEKIADIFQISTEKVMEITTKNAISVFQALNQ